MALPVPIKITTKKTTRTEFQIELDNRIIIIAMRSLGYVIPDNAQVVFNVPGGADWANTEIEISKDDPVTLSWVETKETSS